MPQRSETTAVSLADIVQKLSDKDRAFNFDITLELTTRNVRVGTLRMHGKIEAVGFKRR